MISDFNEIYDIFKSKRKQSAGQIFHEFVLRKIPDNGGPRSKNHVHVFTLIYYLVVCSYFGG